jgi:hypothetical protein
MSMSVEHQHPARPAQGAPKAFPTQVRDNLFGRNAKAAIHYPKTLNGLAEFLIVGHDLLYGSFVETRGVMVPTHWRDVWSGRRNLTAFDLLRMRDGSEQEKEVARAFARRLEFEGQSLREPLEALLGVLQRARKDPQFSER